LQPQAVIDIKIEEIAEAFHDKLKVSMTNTRQSYGKSTHEHIDKFLAQLGELVYREAFHIRLFSLSLTDTTFAWFAALPPNSIYSWGDLEHKFHEHFSLDNELELVDLAALRQGWDDLVNDYIRRFQDTINQCF
jgi:hypothetical protein